MRILPKILNSLKRGSQLDFSRPETAEYDSRVDDATVLIANMVKAVVLPPDIYSGNYNSGHADPSNINTELESTKIDLLKAMLEKHGIPFDPRDHITGILPGNIRRKKSYRLIPIPKLNKIILINECSNEATFIVDSVYSIDEIINANKSELLTKYNANKIIFTRNDPNKWIETIELILFQNNNQPTQAIAQSINSLDYFLDKNNIRSNLLAFAQKLGLKSPLNILTSTDFSTIIQCESGQFITWGTWLNNLGISHNLGRFTNTNQPTDLHTTKKNILNFALEYSGFQIRNTNYYANTNNILQDIQAFEAKSGLKFIDIPIKSKLYAICSNGEEVEFRKYLREIGVLKLGLSREQAEFKTAKIKKDLLENLSFSLL